MSTATTHQAMTRSEEVLHGLPKISRADMTRAATKLADFLSPADARSTGAPAPRTSADGRREPIHAHELAERGFIHLRNVVPVALVERLRERVYTSLASLRMPTRRGGAASVFQSAHALDEIDRVTSAVAFIEQTTRSAPFGAVVRHCQRRVLPTVARGPLDLKGDRHARWLRVGLPSHITRLPAHQDVFYLHPEAPFLTVWVPLHDCPAALGGLRVVPGSHRVGPLLHEGLAGIPLRGKGVRWKTFDFEVGDALVFDRYTIHSSGQNRSANQVRFSVDFRLVIDS